MRAKKHATAEQRFPTKKTRRSHKLSSNELLSSYVEATGYALGRPPPKPPGKTPELRGALAFEACKDGALIIYVTPPTGAEHWWDGEPIRIEPHRVCEVLAACGDALARKPSTR